jgi:hypothetical protein
LLLDPSSFPSTYQMGPIADKGEGKMDIEWAEENRVAMANEVLTPEVLQHIANALEYRQYMFERERSRREAVRIERERREKLEDDERWERLARHMEEYRNLLRSRSRPRR